MDSHADKGQTDGHTRDGYKTLRNGQLGLYSFFILQFCTYILSHNRLPEIDNEPLKYLVIQLQKVIAVEFLQSILTWKSSLVT